MGMSADPAGPLAWRTDGSHAPQRGCGSLLPFWRSAIVDGREKPRQVREMGSAILVLLSQHVLQGAHTGVDDGRLDVLLALQAAPSRHILRGPKAVQRA